MRESPKCREKTESKRKGDGKIPKAFHGIPFRDVVRLNNTLQDQEKHKRRARTPRPLTGQEVKALELYWDWRLAVMHLSINAGRDTDFLDYGHDVQRLDYDGRNTYEYKAPTTAELEDE